MEFLTKEWIYQKNSQELTSLLYEACLDNLEHAIAAIETKDYVEANIKLQKVNDILERLGVGLNYGAGVIADQLDTLYNYMANKVVTANMKKDTASLKEVANMIEMLASAWNEAIKNKEAGASGQELHQRKTKAYEQNVMVLTRD